MSWKYWSGKVGGGGLPFIFEINTANTSVGSTANNQFKLPLFSSGVYDFTVDWGDSSSDVITVWDQAETIHTYAATGTYTITITGIMEGWRFADVGDRLKMLDISQFGIAKFINFGVFNGAFNGCANLDITATDIPNLSGVTSMQGFFRDCSSLTFNSSINSWNVSSVERMDSLFMDSSFNQTIGNWDVSSATNMSEMFRRSGFNQNISGWDVSNVDNFQAMFGGSTVFNQPIGSWDVSSATNMRQMFVNATGFNQPIGNWDVSNVSDFVGFMQGKSPANYSATNLDAIYNGWSALPSLVSGRSISFGSIKYTLAGQTGRNILTGAPNNWTITDGGI